MALKGFVIFQDVELYILFLKVKYSFSKTLYCLVILSKFFYLIKISLEYSCDLFSNLVISQFNESIL